MEVDKLELDSEEELLNITAQTRNIRKNIPLKKDTSKNRGRPRKTSRNIKLKKPNAKSLLCPDDDDDRTCDDDDMQKKESSGFISEKEPLHHNQKLKWDYKVNLVGEKVVDPRIHSCEKCSLPILIYGRMIPCKHVFCFDCAKKTDKHCPRCSESVQRIEQSALGTVFMCTYGGSKHGTGGCRRTYLSQRDLQAHINHRHLRSAENQSSQIVPKIPEYETRVHNPPIENIPPRHHPPPPENMMYPRQNEEIHLHQNHPIPKSHGYMSSIPVMTNTRTNLITVPIQDDSDFSHPERPIYKPLINPPLQPHSPAPPTFGPAQTSNCNPHPGQPHCPPPMPTHMSVTGPPPVSYASAPPMNPSYSVPPMQPGSHAPPLPIRPHGPLMSNNQGMYSTMAPLHPGPSGPVSAPPPPPPPHHVVPVNHGVMQPQPHQPHPQPHQQHPQSHQPPHPQGHPPHSQQPHPAPPPIRYDPGPIHMNPRHPPNFEEPHLNSPPYSQSSNLSPCAPWTPNLNQPPPQRNLPPNNNPPMGGSAPHIPPDKNVYRPYYQ